MTTLSPSGLRGWGLLSGKERYIPVAATFLLLIVMFGVGAGRYDNFLDPQNVLDLFDNNAFLLVVAVGMTFVILTGGIDLSVGSVVALSTVVSATLIQNHGWSPLAVIPVVLLIGVLLGAAMGAIIQFYDIQPFIVTLAGMFFARGLCYVVSAESISIKDESFLAIARAKVEFGEYSLSSGALISLVALALGIYVLHYTRLGRNVYAIGGNEQSALLMGLSVARTKVTVYAISGFCSALGGVLLTFYMRSGWSRHADGLELQAIAAVVIGGILLTGGQGFLVGALLGVLVEGVILTIITFEGDLSSWWTRIANGSLLLVFVVLQRAVAGRKRRR